MWPIAVIAAFFLAGCMKDEDPSQRGEHSTPPPSNSSNNNSPQNIKPSVSPIRDEYKNSVRDAVVSQLQNSDYVFIGESHAVKEEGFFSPMMKAFYAAGARTLAVEMATHEQAGLDTLSRTGKVDPNLFPNHTQVMAWPEFQGLYRAAAQAGLKLLAVDQPSHLRSSPAKREQYIAEHLMSSGGKTLVWMGAIHSMNLQKPYPTARGILQNNGVTTSSMVLESATLLRFENSFHLGISASAFQTYFMQPPVSSFAYPARQLDLSTIVALPTGSHEEVTQTLPYVQLVDYIAFLSTQDGGDAGRTNRWNF